MRGLAVALFALAGCFDNPAVEVDTEALAMPQGTTNDVTISVDGAPVNDLSSVVWLVDDPTIVSVTPEYDHRRLRIGAANQGETVVHVSSHGQTLDIPTRVGPAAITYVWIEPSSITAAVGMQVHVKGTGLDTMYKRRDVTLDSRWTVADERVANLDTAGMMLHAMGQGRTTLHATYGDLATSTDIVVE